MIRTPYRSLSLSEPFDSGQFRVEQLACIDHALSYASGHYKTLYWMTLLWICVQGVDDLDDFIVESGCDASLSNAGEADGANGPVVLSVHSLPEEAFFKIYLELLLQLQGDDREQVMANLQPGTIHYEAAKKIEGKICDTM